MFSITCPSLPGKLCEMCEDALNWHKTAVNSGYKQHQIKTGNYKVDVVLRDPICVQEWLPGLSIDFDNTSSQECDKN